MDQLLSLNDAKDVASKIDAEIRALPVWNTPNERAIRRKYSRKLNQASPEFILNLAKVLLKNYGYRGLPYELVRNHRAAFQCIGARTIRTFGGYWRREVPARSAPAYEHQLQQKATTIGSNSSSLIASSRLNSPGGCSTSLRFQRGLHHGGNLIQLVVPDEYPELRVVEPLGQRSRSQCL